MRPNNPFSEKYFLFTKLLYELSNCISEGKDTLSLDFGLNPQLKYWNFMAGDIEPMTDLNRSNNHVLSIVGSE